MKPFRSHRNEYGYRAVVEVKVLNGGIGQNSGIGFARSGGNGRQRDDGSTRSIWRDYGSYNGGPRLRVAPPLAIDERT